MDVLDFINRNGQRTVPNPAYNPKSKKNTAPATIIVPDVVQSPVDAVEMARRDAINQYSISSKDNEKYRRAGINWNPRENLDNLLADSQGNFTKFWNAGKQLLWSELVLGIGKGFSDIVGGLINIPAAFGADGNYNNPVSDFFERQINEFNEDNPIYVRDDAKWYDPGYLASHIPAVGGMAAMLIPVGVTAKAVSWLGRAARVGKGVRASVRALTGANKVRDFEELSKFGQRANANSTIQTTNAILGVGGQAVINRAMWDYSEARSVHNEMYTKAYDKLSRMSQEDYNEWLSSNKDAFGDVDTNDRNAVAQAIANKSANEAFMFDRTNVIFDAVQLWGLRNITKGLKNAKLSPALRKQQREDIMFAGKTTEEIKKIKENISLLDRAKWFVGDYTVGNRPFIYGQLAGGAQMSLVHIGHLEGINVGDVLLGEKPASSFDDRLHGYLASPELYENTIWGMIAGSVFHVAGSKIRQGFNTVERKIDERDRAKAAGEDKVDDKDKKSTGWRLLDELPEIKRRRVNMQSRNQKLNDYVTAIDKINQNLDPYNTDKNGGFLPLKSDADKARARQQAEDAMIFNMTLDAAANGNLKYLKEYIKSEEVKDYLVQKGVFDKENADAQQARLLEKIESVDSRYDREVFNTMQHLDAISLTRKRQIPIQYAQIIAKENLQHRINIENIEKYTADLDAEISNRIQELIDDGKISNDNRIRLISEISITTHQLGQLYAERDRLVGTKKSDASTMTALNRINSQIDILESRIEDYFPNIDSASNQHLAALLFAKSHAKAYKFEEGKSVPTPTNRKATADALNDIFVDTEEGIKTINEDAFADLTGWVPDETAKVAIREEYEKILNDLDKQYDTEKGISAIDSQLATNLASYASLRNLLSIEKNNITSTREEIMHRVNSLDNFFDVHRVKVVQKAFDTIKDLQTKHDVPGSNINILELFARAHEGESLKNLSNLLPEEDRAKFSEAIEILDLANDDNASLVNTIYQALLANMFNNVAASTERNRTGNVDTETQNSSTSPQADSGIENGKPINISQSGTPQGGEAGNGQNERVLGENGSQPVSYMNLEVGADKDGNPIYKTSKSDKDNSRIALIPTEGEENLFELIAPTTDGLDKSILSNDDFFMIGEDGRLPSEGAIVDVNPIVRLNNDGSISVWSKGKLKGNDGNPSTDISSTGERPADKTRLAFSDDDKVSQADKDTQGIGLFGQQPKPDTRPTPMEASVEVDPETGKPVMALEDQAIRSTAKDFYAKSRASNLPFVSSELRDKLVNLFVKEGADNEASVRQQIDIATKFWESFAERQGVSVVRDEAEDIINDVVLRSASVSEAKQNTKFEDDFVNAVNKLIKKYVKDTNGDVVNGKAAVKLEDLLRYCNEHSKNQYTAQVMYDTFVKYLKTDAAKEKYIISDIRDADNGNVLTRAMRNQERRFEELMAEEKGSRINTNDILDLLEASDKDEYAAVSKVLFESNIGDEVSLSTDGNGRVLFKIKGKAVGNLPSPKIDGKTGGYYQINKDVVSDVLVDGSGNIMSKLKDRLSEWLEGYASDETLKDLNDILIEYRFADKKRRSELFNDFVKNEAVLKAISDGIIVRGSENALEHLSNIWNYTKQFSGIDVETTNNFRVRSLDLWFKKLHNSYTTMAEISAHPERYSVKISRINDGEVIRATDDENGQPIPIKNAIGSAHKGQVKIAAVDNYDPGYIQIAGIGRVKTNLGTSSTVITIPNRRGGYEEVHAFAQGLRSNNLAGTKASEMVKAFSDVIAKHLTASVDIHKIGDREAAYKRLEQVFNDLFNSGTSNLFKGWKISKNYLADKVTESGFVLYNSKGDSISFFYKALNTKTGKAFETNNIRLSIDDVNGQKAKARQLDASNLDKTIQDVTKLILDNTSFNLAFSHIRSDYNPAELLKGVAHRSADGKFVITIGDKAWKFDSYNDFVIENNIINVNTHPDEQGYTNFNRKAVRSNANQMFEVSFQRKASSSPVEKNVDNTSGAPDIMVKVFKALENNGGKKGKGIQNTGKELSRLVLGKEKIGAISSPKKGISLFPSDVVYVEDFNSLDGYGDSIAATNTTGHDIKLANGQVIKDGQVVIGKKFIDMLSNPKTRWEAPYKLIHEQVHNILHKDGNEKYIEQVREIYDEFVKANEADGINKHTAEKPTVRVYEFDSYKDENGRLTTDGLEEFLVESLTSKTLADRLNAISRTDVSDGVSKKRSLLQKIMDIINKAFGWDVKEGSLREKEFEALRDFMDKAKKETEIKTKEQKTEETTKVEAVTPEVKEVPLVTTQPKPEDAAKLERPSNPFGRNRGRDSKFRKSEVEESFIGEDKLPNMAVLRDELSLEDKEKFNELVSKGAISIVCK